MRTRFVILNILNSLTQLLRDVRMFCCRNLYSLTTWVLGHKVTFTIIIGKETSAGELSVDGLEHMLFKAIFSI